MDKKEFVIPISVISLSVIFAGVCLGVFLTKGKSAKWVNRKMKIGALLLTITAVSCNDKEKGKVVTMCYVPAPVNQIVLDAHTSDTIKIKLDTSNVLKGSVYGVTKSDFSFAVIDEKEAKIQKGTLMSEDGGFNEGTEKFTIELDENLNTGVYDLRFFETTVAEQDNIAHQMNVKLQIKDQ